MSHSITDLRTTLFETLKGIRDGSIDLEKARAINEVSKTIVDSAKVEVDFLRVTGNEDSPFLKIGDGKGGVVPGTPPGVTQHRLGR